MNTPDAPILITKDQLVEAIEAGAAEANRRTDWKRLLLAFLAGVLSTAAVAIPVEVILTDRDRTTARTNARVNCTNIRGLAGVEAGRLAQSAQELEDFQRKSKDRFGLTEEQFQALLVKQREREDARVAQLVKIASTNCHDAIQ